MIYFIGALVVAYFIGAIPTGYILGKLIKGIDIREHGSGNVGATNVFRTMGKIPGLIVFIIDFLKGFIVVTLIPFCLIKFFSDPVVFSYGFMYLLLGISAISGHIWTIFLKFKGGKGVATTAGVIAGQSPVIFAVCFVIWITIFSVWRYVSLASIAAAISLPFFAVLSGKSLEFKIFCAIIAVLAVYSHRTNIKRLIQGNEKKLGQKKQR